MKIIILLLTVFHFILATTDNSLFLNQLKGCDLSHEKIQANSNRCITKVMRFLIEENRKSDAPYMGLVIPEPLILGEFPFIQNTGPLNIKSEFINVHLYGLSNLTLVNASINFAGRTVILYIKMADVFMDGRYTMNGNVLLLPIEGEGDFFVNSQNSVSKIELSVIRNKNKPDYLGITNAKASATIETADMQFLNLFAEDPILDETMHHFLNNNPEIIIEEITPFLDSQVADVLQKTFHDVFSNIPVKHIYPDGNIEGF